MIPLWQNPEFIRNCRAQLRPRRLAMVALIVAALSIVVGYTTYQSFDTAARWGETLFSVAFYAQIFTLCIGGGGACSRSISHERDQNTFDFQRVTQLSSLELALGKLFGAPAISYFAALCMVPAALVGAVAAGVPPLRLVIAYVILLAGSIAIHSVALLVSLGTTKTGGGIAGLSAVALLSLALLFTSFPDTSRLVLDMGKLGPSAAADFALHGTWELRTWHSNDGAYAVSVSPWTDVFFGIPLHHVPVLLVLYLTFTVWCLVPLARNLKKDPALVELYSPAQSVGLLTYINIIMAGFYMTYRIESSSFAQGEQSLSTRFEFFLTANLTLLYCLGLALIRNREQTRRRAYQRGAGGIDWLEAGWPSVYILAGAACAAIVFLSRFGLAYAQNDFEPRFVVFVCALLLATMLRDLCFLQWMNLRRSKRPLMIGMILVSVFYLCGGLLLGLARFSRPVATVFTAIVAPWPMATASYAESVEWLQNPSAWFIGLAFQIALATLFAALHYSAAEELRPARTPAPARAPAT